MQSSLFCKVRLDEEEWKRHLEDEEHVVKTRRIKRYKPPRQFEWQWDGLVYSVGPGEEITVPKAAADAGYRASLIFPRERDETGKELMTLDHNGNRNPMIEIVETFDPMNAGLQASQPSIPKQESQRCPFCHSDVDDLGEHLSGECTQGTFASKDNPDAMADDLRRSMEAVSA